MDVSKTYNANAKDELKDNLYLTEQWPKEDVKYIFLPFGSFKTYWDLFTLTFVIYTAMVLPLSIFYYPDDMCIPAWMVRRTQKLPLLVRTLVLLAPSCCSHPRVARTLVLLAPSCGYCLRPLEVLHA